MKFQAQINVMPLDELLDPEGKAVTHGLNDLSLSQVKQVRVGKHIVLTLEADNKEEAETIADRACQELLVNPVIEKYDYHVEEA